MTARSTFELERDMFAAFATWMLDCYKTGTPIDSKQLESTTGIPTTIDYQDGADAVHGAACWLAAMVFRDAKVFRKDDRAQRQLRLCIKATPREHGSENVERVDFDEYVQKVEDELKSRRDACAHEYFAHPNSATLTCSKCPATRVVEGACAYGRHTPSDDLARCTACLATFDPDLQHLIELDSRLDRRS